MIYSKYKKSKIIFTFSILFTTLISACSSNLHYKYQISNDTSYLNTMPLVKLYTPAGISLPTVNNNFVIPDISTGKITDKIPDIYPPIICQSIIFEKQNQFKYHSTMLIVKNWCDNTLWSQIVKIIQLKKYIIEQRDDHNHILIIKCIKWHQFNAKRKSCNSYQISVKQNGYQQTIIVKLLNFEQAGKQIIDKNLLQYNSKELLDIIHTELKKSIKCG